MKVLFVVCAVLSAVLFVNAAKFADSDGLALSDYSITDDERKCIHDGYKRTAAEHPELKEWFDDITESAQNLTELVAECKTLTGLSQLRCYGAVVLYWRQTYIRLFTNLTEEQKQIVEELNDIVNGCLSGENDIYSVESSETFSSRATINQIKCILGGYYKVVKENPELKSWYQDVVKTAEAIAEKAQECQAQSEPEQEKCFAELAETLQTEVNRLVESLKGVEEDIYNELKKVSQECLDN